MFLLVEKTSAGLSVDGGGVQGRRNLLGGIVIENPLPPTKVRLTRIGCSFVVSAKVSLMIVVV